MTEYKIIDEAYYPDTMTLASYAFNKTLSEERTKLNLEMKKRGYPLGAFQDGILTSQVVVYHYIASVFGVPYKMGGIGEVASYPEYRGGGDAGNLMKLALKTMKENGITISYLAPFSYRYYRKYGYEQLFDQLILTFEPGELPKFKGQGKGKIRRLNLAQGMTDISNVYETYAKAHHGLLMRDEMRYLATQARTPNRQFAIYYNEQNEATGYLVYQMEGETFIIKELITLEQDAFYDLWDFVRGHGMSFKQFQYITTPEQNIAYLLDENTIKQEIKADMMGRIVDFVPFIQAYPFAADLENNLYLSVSDQTAPWNEGLWKLAVKNGKGSLTKFEGIAPKEKMIEGSIQSFTQLFFNYRDAATLQQFGRVLASEEALALLATVLPKGKPELYDYF
ncbi:GNAT family N-acetyltransferase [Isobaculum melis]|uniref:Predicted acetyltransferase n=1 Tax=Isobaculum melis TaxID=142588 RepID=A0A1H9SX43_9LACT|nr:GNAT family N-acetyltransferase [Isobaculum melis]SER88953.1 Predicted acetyltransferase [Isobaculum melis]